MKKNMSVDWSILLEPSCGLSEVMWHTRLMACICMICSCIFESLYFVYLLYAFGIQCIDLFCLHLLHHEGSLCSTHTATECSVYACLCVCVGERDGVKKEVSWCIRVCVCFCVDLFEF